MPKSPHSRRRPAPSGPARVALLAFPDVQMLDVAGPLEVFARASQWMCETGERDEPAYAPEIVGLTRGPLRTSAGARVVAERGFLEIGRGIDTLLVAGGVDPAECRGHQPLLRWLRRQAGEVRRLGSICTGAFLLAEAGLLDTRRVTTHWRHGEALAREFPSIQVEADELVVRDGSLYTAGGVSAGMDLALALVEEDFGRDVALATARELVLFLRRPGGQAQFRVPAIEHPAERESLRALQTYIREHPHEDLSVERLARKVSMSPRHFARVFAQDVGTTPAKFVAAVRLETARRLLEEGGDSLDAVCARSGLGTAESMRRAFVRAVGVAPGQYRERFRHTPRSAAAR